MQVLEPILSRLHGAIQAADGEACTFALSVNERARLKQTDGGEALDCFNQLVEIAVHPCPQNRREGSPYCGQDPGWSCWYDEQHNVARELTGLLSLTTMEMPAGRVDPIRPPTVRYDSPDRVVRRDVADCIAAHLEGTLSRIRGSLRTVESEAASREAQLNKDMQVAAEMEHGELLALYGKTEQQRVQGQAAELEDARRYASILASN
jgi:hypothetical protein